MSDRIPARGKHRSRLTRHTMLRGPNRPSSAGCSGTARWYALASGSRGFSRAVSIAPPRYRPQRPHPGGFPDSPDYPGVAPKPRSVSPDYPGWRTSLGQDFLSFREMLDRLGANLFEPRGQALAQDPRAGRRGVQPRNEDEVGPFFVEAQRLW